MASRQPQIVVPILTAEQARAVLQALDSEIASRYEANRDSQGERIDTEDDAIDAIVPALEASRTAIGDAYRTPFTRPQHPGEFYIEVAVPKRLWEGR